MLILITKAPNPEPELCSNIRGLSLANIRISVHPKKHERQPLNGAVNVYSAHTLLLKSVIYKEVFALHACYSQGFQCMSNSS